MLLLLLVFSRRPQDLLHAQFYAEDGKRWFAQAYNLGWLRSLAIPDSEYLQVLPRLPAGIALLLPFTAAPLVMKIAAALIQVAPAVMLMSPLCRRWGAFPVRVLMAAIFIANPNAPELHVVMCNAQWHYALAELLLIFAPVPRALFWRALVLLVFLIGGFSGPFGIALLPVMAVYWLVRRERWTLVLAALLAIGTVVQVQTIRSGAIYNAPYDTPQPTRVDVEKIPLGASASLLAQIVGDDIVLNSVTGSNGPRVLRRIPVSAAFLLVVLGAVPVLFAVWSGPLEYKLFTAFALVLFAISIADPMVAGSGTRWQVLLSVGGMRYYALPSLVLLWALVYCVRQTSYRPLRRAAFAALLVFIFGAARRWEYPSWPDMHFAAEERQLEQARPGEVVYMPIVPEGWTMTLIKR